MTATTYQPRPYQSDAIANWKTFVASNPGAHPLVVMPTGSGKSVVLAEMARTVAEHPTHPARVLVLTHVKELVEQDAEKLTAALGPEMVGVYSAGLGRRDLDQPVIVAGIQSVATKAWELTNAGAFGLVIVDECHLVPKDGFGRYRQLAHAFETASPGAIWTGLTATPFRLKGGYIHQGEGRIFTHVAHSVDVVPLIDAGFLSPLTAKAPKAKIDVTGIHSRGGDFVRKELEERVLEGDKVAQAVKEIVERGRDRRSWLVFASSVTHAQALRDEVARYGVAVGMVDGKTPAGERDRLISAFRAGELRCLVNVNVLTTGFDAPETDLLAVLRPTKSTALYVQIMGRGMRIAEGKEDCLVLDFGGNVARHGPLNSIELDPEDPEKEPGVAPTKECPECASILHAGVRECPDCGFVFPEPELKHEAKAAEADIIARPKVYEIDVDHVSYFRHKGKEGKPDTLRVEYLCGLRLFREWFSYEPSANAGALAMGERFWRERCPGRPCPKSLDEALERAAAGELRRPEQIRVSENPAAKFPRILARLG